jgi:hypothetical protein
MAEAIACGSPAKTFEVTTIDCIPNAVADAPTKKVSRRGVLRGVAISAPELLEVVSVREKDVSIMGMFAMPSESFTPGGEREIAVKIHDKYQTAFTNSERSLDEVPELAYMIEIRAWEDSPGPSAQKLLEIGGSAVGKVVALPFTSFGVYRGISYINMKQSVLLKVLSQ